MFGKEKLYLIVIVIVMYMCVCFLSFVNCVDKFIVLFLGREGCDYSSSYWFREDVCVSSSGFTEAVCGSCGTEEACSGCVYCCSYSRIVSTSIYQFSWATLCFLEICVLSLGNAVIVSYSWIVSKSSDQFFVVMFNFTELCVWV